MIERALSILKILSRDTSTRQKRNLKILKDPRAEMAEGWFMCVRSCYHEALDIGMTERVYIDELTKTKKTKLVWTQGSWFYFKAGDVLYDTAEAYGEKWVDALQRIKLCVEITSANRAGQNNHETGRSAGSVTFSIKTPNEDHDQLIKRGEHSMSQDDFLRFLISGPPAEVKRLMDRK